ncbi:peptide chain release factor N(5)-glutamine methyltransferase [Bifidobacterium sp. SMB2]|uniref:Release factor glutamine methyltransferase n=1 Tax=Bifidobacterium saimiriisciurei TaxID=2661627 RepID=A0ABX0CAZ1_9BIFI|nr:MULTISPECIES: peptide chain release factor N(5)-glutamine methyltransferase [Bifidobacterium]NEG96710.1 peptide chain release factor N(5)-glutamine methyltransferase [Bifidobacterium sp. SMB2]NEH11866.1 peptide chain release factor N(5)-glutamine methyltransferase [Bifidobacterium saimiriisciurei]
MDVAETLRSAARRLSAAGIDTPAFDAKLLLAHAAGVQPRDVDKAMLLGDTLPFDGDSFDAMVSRRAEREPLQYITGLAPFRYLDMEVGPGVFIPRPETETLVQSGLDWLSGHEIGHPRVVDLCAGSGAIGLSVASEIPDSEVWAVELSETTYAWTERNRLRVIADHPGVDGRYHLTLGDATAASTLRDLDGTIDLVISNPPYIPETDVPEQPEVRDHDPNLALYGGSADGLRIPERIIDRSAALLRDGGALVMEHDISQGEALRAYAAAHGFAEARTGNDLTGRPRYLFAVYCA